MFLQKPCALRTSGARSALMTNTQSKRWVTTRHEAMKVKCPRCNAAPQLHCWGNGTAKIRKSAHQERHDEAIRLGAPVSLPRF